MEALMANSVHMVTLIGAIWDAVTGNPALAFIAFGGLLTVAIGIFTGIKGAAHL